MGRRALGKHGCRDRRGGRGPQGIVAEQVGVRMIRVEAAGDILVVGATDFIARLLQLSDGLADPATDLVVEQGSYGRKLVTA